MSPAGSFHGLVASRFNYHLSRYVHEHDLGEVFAAETGFVLDAGPKKTKVRAPDVAFIRKDRLAGAITPKFCPIAPDLVVEVLSPDDRVGEVNEKVKDWLRFGVRLVLVTDPDTRTVAVHEPGRRVRTYNDHETLTGGDVLPAFELPLRELFK